jgi:hypothetical protein
MPSRPDVEEPTAGPERLFDITDSLGDLHALGGHGVGHKAILGVHDVHDLERRREVDLGGSRIALLGNARVEAWGHGGSRLGLGSRRVSQERCDGAAPH